MDEENPLLDELRALGDQTEEEQPAVQFGETAAYLRDQGYFDDLVSRQQGERAAKESKGFLDSVVEGARTSLGIDADPSAPAQDKISEIFKYNPIAEFLTRGLAKKAATGDASELQKGIVRGFAGTREMAGKGLEQFGQTVSSQALRDYGTQVAKEAGPVRESKLVAPAVPDYSEIRKEKWFSDTAKYLESKLGEGVGNMAGVAAFYGAGGTLGGAGFLVTISVGDARREIQDLGITDERQIAPYAYGAGLTIAMLERVFPEYLARQMTAPVKKAIARHMLKTFVRGAAGGAWREGITEALQEGVLIVAGTHALQTRDGALAPIFNEGTIAALTSPEGRKRMVEAGIAGAVPGGGLGGVVSTGRAAGARKDEEGEKAPPGPETDQRGVVIGVAPKGQETAVPEVRGMAVQRPSIDHSTLSPSGRVSERARHAALERTRVELFGEEGLQRAPVPQPTEQESLLRQAANLRDLAERGMSPRLFVKQAAELEARAAELATAEPPATGKDSLQVPAVKEGLTTPTIDIPALTERIASVKRKAQLASIAEEQGLELSDEILSKPLKTIREEILKAAEAKQATPATEAKPAEEADQADDLTPIFRSLLASDARRSTWAKRLGVSEAELKPLIEQAVSDGFLRVNKNGVVRRTEKAKVVSGDRVEQAERVLPSQPSVPGEAGRQTAREGIVSPSQQQGSGEGTQAATRAAGRLKPRLPSQQIAASLSIPSDLRIDRNVMYREAQLGRAVPQVVVDYAVRLEDALGTRDFVSIIDDLRADDIMLKKDIHDLAAVMGVPVAKSATKEAAFKTIIAKNEKATVQQKDADEFLAAIGGGLGRALQVIDADIRAGKSVKILQQVIDDVHEVVERFEPLIPDGFKVGVLSSLQPVGEGSVIATFEDMRGGAESIIVPWDQLVRHRSFFYGRKNLIGIMRFLPRAKAAQLADKMLGDRNLGIRTVPSQEFGHAGDFENGVAAELLHEITHLYRRSKRLGGDMWPRLLERGRALLLLDSQFGTYLQAVGNPFWQHAEDVSVRQKYEEAYQQIYPDPQEFQEAMDQEDVTHMVEWWVRGLLNSEDVVEVRDVLEAILSGDIARSEPQDSGLMTPELAALGAQVHTFELDERGFFSPSLEAAKRIPQESGTVQQMRAMLLNAGAKPKELEAIGFDQAFPDSQAKVSRQQVEEFLRGNRVGLGEQSYPRQSDWRSIEAVPAELDAAAQHYYGETFADLTEPQRATVREVAGIVAEESVAPRFETYSTPGGIPGSYREVVTTLPSGLGKVDAEIRDIVNRNGIQHGGHYAEALEEVANSPSKDAPRARELIANWEKEYSSEYTSTHWPGITNPLLHYRTKDFVSGDRLEQGAALTPSQPSLLGEPGRTSRSPVQAYGSGEGSQVSAGGAGGLKTRVLDELQSDWAQRARDQGTRDPAAIESLRKDRNKVVSDIEKIYDEGAALLGVSFKDIPESRLAEKQVYVENALKSSDNPGKREWAARLDAHQDRYNDLQNKVDAAEKGVPSAPFISNTSDWVDLGLKQVLMDAVKDPSVSRLAWAPGGVQNERYSLASHVDGIQVRAPINEGRRTFRIFGRGNSVLADLGVGKDGIIHRADGMQEAKGKPLSEVVGRELADKLMAEKDGVTLQGDGLSFGGEGMKSFYGDFTPEGSYTPGIVGTRLLKIVKALDPSVKIEPHGDFYGGEKFPVYRADGTLEGAYLTEEHARKVAKQIGGKTEVPTRPYPSIPITPKLREKLLRGQPLFAIGSRLPPLQIGSSTSTGLDKPSQSLSDLVGEVTDAIGITTRMGRLDPGLKASARAQGGELMGQFGTVTGVARIKIPNDLQVLAHEGGHALEVRPSLRVELDDLKFRFASELTSPTITDLSEGFAEFFRLYVVNPTLAQAQAPQFFAEFEDLLDANEPAMLEALEGIQNGVVELANASPFGIVRSREQSSVNPGMLQALRQEIADKGWGNTMQDRLYIFYTGYFDGRHPMKKAVKYLLQTAQANLGLQLGDKERLVIKAIDDPYKLWRLSEHAKVWATSDLQNGIRHKGEADPSGPSFRDALIQAFGGTWKGQWNPEISEAFSSYLRTRRILAEFERFDQGLREDMPDLMIGRDIWEKARTDAEAAYPQFIQAADTLYQFQRNVLRLKFENGFLTEDLYNELLGRVDYVPLNRVMDDDGPSALTSARGQNKSKMIRRQTNSSRDFINTLELIAQDVYATRARIALNDVIRATDRLARAAGPGGGRISERIPARDMQSVTADVREVLRKAAKDAGLAQSDTDGLLDIIDDLFDQNASASIFRATDINEKGEPIVYLWEEGKRVPIRLGDDRIGKDIFEGFALMGTNNAEPFIDALSLGAQGFRFGVTKAPAYIVVNFLRDQLATWALSRDYVPFVTGAKGLGSVLADTKTGERLGFTGETAKRYKAFAGLSGIESNLIETAAKKRDALTLRRKGFSAAPTKWQSLLRMMEVTEAASRVGHFSAAYNRAIADGFTPEEAGYEAAYAAHDVLDFSRRGSKMAQIARIIAFMNSTLQGLDAFRRTYRGERDIHSAYRDLASPYIKAATGSPLSIAEKEALPNSARVWVKLTVGIGMVGVALAALYRDDEEYEEFNDYMKATHWFFKVGGVWWRVPKPFELAILSNVFEATFDRVWKQDERALTRFLESLRNTVMPPAEVQGLAALGQIAELPKAAWNKLVTKDPYSKTSGDSAVPQHLRKLPPELQFTAYTSEFGRMLGATLHWSPAEIDRFVTNTFATLGRDVLSASDQVLPWLNRQTGGAIPGVSKSPRADKSLEDYWVISRFTRREARGALSSQEFWKQMSQDGGEYVRAGAGYKELADAGKINPGYSRDARDLLDRLTPDQRAYAIVEGAFKEGEQDLHPLNRARQVLSAMSGIRKDLMLDRLVRQETTKRGRTPEKLVLSPSKQKAVNEILEDLGMREARNALIAIGHPGWKNRDMMPTDGLITELKAASPEIAKELEYRLAKGRNKVYSFDAVKALWPEARDRLLTQGEDAKLYDLKAKASTYRAMGRSSQSAMPAYQTAP